MERVLRNTLPDGEFAGLSAHRTRNMRAIRGRGNVTTENRLRFALVRAGLSGWKVRPAGMIGNPDFSFPREHVVIFTDGCFWHGCPKCDHAPIKTNADYWNTKVRRNRQRDARVSRQLRRAGWRVLRVWEHEIIRSTGTVIPRIVQALRGRR